jgi:ABC-type multidrug transport system fused ATPase/permease subunit
MKQSANQIFTFMHVVAWVVFIGKCIKTGSLVFSTIISIFINPTATKDLYLGLNLSALYETNTWYYIAIVSLIIFISAMQAYLFYLLIKIFSKLNLVQPFSNEISKLISKISYVALDIGILSIIANGFSKWMIKREISIYNANEYLGGAIEYLLLAGIIFTIAQIFKRGVEIQNENELTV